MRPDLTLKKASVLALNGPDCAIRGIMQAFWESVSLLLLLLNPFLMSIYLVDFIRGLTLGVFARVMIRAAFISLVVFLLFAFFGDQLFLNFFQVHFDSFMIFGGLVFLIIGLRFVMYGAEAMTGLRGFSRHISGSIAMPFMIGPGTVSASVIIGSRHNIAVAGLAIGVGIGLSVGLLIALKGAHDYIRSRHESLIERYIDLTGRASALFIGSFAVEMILKGLEGWWSRLSGG